MSSEEQHFFWIGHRVLPEHAILLMKALLIDGCLWDTVHGHHMARRKTEHNGSLFLFRTVMSLTLLLQSFPDSPRWILTSACSLIIWMTVPMLLFMYEEKTWVPTKPWHISTIANAQLMCRTLNFPETVKPPYSVVSYLRPDLPVVWPKMTIRLLISFRVVH